MHSDAAGAVCWRHCYKVTYDGGSVPETKAGAGLKMYIEAKQIRFVEDKQEVVTIPAAAITAVHPREQFVQSEQGGEVTLRGLIVWCWMRPGPESSEKRPGPY